MSKARKEFYKLANKDFISIVDMETHVEDAYKYIKELEQQIESFNDFYTVKHMNLLKEQNEEMLKLLIEEFEYQTSPIRLKRLALNIEKITGKSIEEVLNERL
jgi:hypothetical protein